MPVTLPQLDSLTYDQIFTDLVRRIPAYSPEWTDYNDSDPGITLIQLFAYLGEMIGYRLNQVPQASQANLLQLLGVTLSPATPATTQLAMLLTDPTQLKASTLASGTSIKAGQGSPPPFFTTDQDLSVVPIEPVSLITTFGPDLRTAWAPDKPNPRVNDLTVVWDGQTPKLQDMPLKPVTLAPSDRQRYLWIGVNFNSDQSAGVLGARVQLTIQYDADDLPTPAGFARSGAVAPAAQLGSMVDWLYYYDAGTDQVTQVPGRIDDTTGRLAGSGTISFTVPQGIGPIPASEFHPMIPPVVTPPDAFGGAYVQNVQANVGALPSPTVVGTAAWITQYATAMATTLRETIALIPPPPPPPSVPNPLAAKFYNTPGWFRITLPAAPAPPTESTRLRIAIFNAVSATNAITVSNELVGVGDGRPGQTYQLANGNIQPGSLSLAVQEQPASNNAPLVPWQAVPSLDPYGPFDSVFVPDLETGALIFGDGIKGRIVPLVPQGGNIVALSYVSGGGSSGNRGVGTITIVNSAAPGIASAVNYVPATGGSDTETQAQAQTRTTKMLSTGSRAVSTDDFAWLATQTPSVQVARAQVIPLRKPLSSSTTAAPGQSETPAAGLTDVDMPGAVTVVVVPQTDDPAPTPSLAFLQAVSQYLDTRRLITTELYVAPPQYAQLHNVMVSVAGSPGYTRPQLQAAVSARLATYLHVLTCGDGGGFPFGGELRATDLISQVSQVSGIARVETVTASFTRHKTGANPRTGNLVLVVAASSVDQYNSITLAPEETVSFDAASFVLTTVS